MSCTIIINVRLRQDIRTRCVKWSIGENSFSFLIYHENISWPDSNTNSLAASQKSGHWSWVQYSSTCTTAARFVELIQKAAESCTQSITCALLWLSTPAMDILFSYSWLFLSLKEYSPCLLLKSSGSTVVNVLTYVENGSLNNRCSTLNQVRRGCEYSPSLLQTEDT